MKISLVLDKSLCSNEIVLTCYKKDEKIEKIVKYIKGLATPIIGCLNNSDHVLDCNDILYIESVDNQTFLYTNNHVFKSKEKLVTLEAKFNRHFLSKNFKKCHN